jgi:hypothetical protein
MPTARGGLGVAVVNGKIYAIGGLSYTSHLNTNEMYDPATNTWTTMAAMPTARSAFGIAVYQNKIYCIGGETGEVGAINVTGANEVYDPATNTWEQKAALLTPRSEMHANMVNGKIYVMGGMKFLGMPLLYQSFNDTDVYDPENDSWFTASALPTASWNYASTVLDNKIYIISGGAQEGANQIYDPSTSTWASGAAIPSKFFSSSAAASSTTGILAPKRIYVMGGTTIGEGGVSVNQVYNPYNDSWSTVASMPTARYSLSIVTVNDTLYAVGGFVGLASGPNGWIPTDANEQYLPIDYGTIDPTNQSPTPSPTTNITTEPTQSANPNQSASPQTSSEATQPANPTIPPTQTSSTSPDTLKQELDGSQIALVAAIATIILLTVIVVLVLKRHNRHTPTTPTL